MNLTKGEVLVRLDALQAVVERMPVEAEFSNADKAIYSNPGGIVYRREDEFPHTAVRAAINSPSSPKRPSLRGRDWDICHGDNGGHPPGSP